MWAWLLPILGVAGKWIWHQICRFWGVFLVGAVIVIIGLTWFHWKDNYGNARYHAGYSQALTDHPSYTIESGGKVINLAEQFRYVGVEFKLFFMDFKVGK
jgi:hypothetical protein